MGRGTARRGNREPIPNSCPGRRRVAEVGGGRLAFMTAPEPPISPRGVPQMRTDWLADVARRLAEVGFDRLRALGEDQHGHLTDVVDGETWTFLLMKFSAPHDTVVEFDAELWAPADQGGRPTLRAGFAVAPRWDDAAGSIALVRLEIGPRGAVTFDPENWMVPVPLTGDPLPTPPGVQRDEWTFDGDDAAASGTSTPPVAGPNADVALLDQLPGTRLDLAGAKPIFAGEPVPEIVIGAFAVAPTKGFLGRLRGPRAPQPPLVTLGITAAGPIEAAWTGTGPADDIVADGLVLGDAPPVLTDDQVSFRAPAGTLTLVGPSLAVTLAAAQA